MTQQQREYRNYSYLFFFFSSVFSGFLADAIFNHTGLGRWFSTALFGFLIFQLLRLAFLMRRKSQNSGLK